MTENKPGLDPNWHDPDDAPDLSAPPWAQKVERALRGRPPLRGRPKVATSLRLDADVIEQLRRDGPGWQTRANALLRRALDLKE